MHSLIAIQSDIIIDDRPRTDVTFVRHIPDEKLRTFEFNLPDKPEPQELPDIPENSNPTPDGFQLAITRKAPRPDEFGQEFKNPFTSDGPLMSVVLVQPTYPVGAAERGLEGFVVVEFNVHANGTVGNVTVVQSSSRIFERAAIQAAKRFRFKARVVDGVPLATSGVQYKFRFEMND